MIAIALSVAALLLFAQTNASSVAFDVASIKLNVDAAPGRSGGSCRGTDTLMRGSAGTLPLGRCRFTRTTLKMLINSAYLSGAVAPNRLDAAIVGGPAWTNADTFDVEGVAENPANTTGEQLFRMLQDMLAQQFKLRFHYENREVSGYALVPTRSGHKLKEADGKEERPGNISISMQQMNSPNRSVSLVGQAVQTSDIALILSERLGQPVEDRARISGRYTFTLKWSPGEAEMGPGCTPAVRTSDVAEGPSLFTALQEQLGLRLESQKVSVRLIVIDEVQRPR